MEPLDLYSKIQTLVINEAKKQAELVYEKKGTKYNVADVPTHSHNGIDSVQLNYKNIIQGNKYITLLVEDVVEDVTIGGIFNPTRISFYGFAANNADGTPATKRAVISGEINFGRCFSVSDLTPPIVVTAIGQAVPFVQSGNSMYIDTTDLTKTRVGASGVNFIYAVDDSASVVAQGTVTDYNNQTGVLSISFTVGTNWKIQGGFTIN